MNSIMLIRLSLRSLAHHKGRTFLTMLGIIIGISTIIATLGIGRGVARKQQQKIEAMGNNFIMVTAGNWMARGKVKSTQRKKSLLFKPEDVYYLKQQSEHIAYASPCTNDKTVISTESCNLETDIKSGNQDILTILGRELEEGVSFTHEQAQSGEMVIVLGSLAAKTLFPQGNPLGKLVTILKHKYRVIGVIKHMTNYWGAADPNLEAFVPFKVAQKKINEWKINKFHMMVMSAYSREKMPQASSDISTLLRIRRNIAPEETSDFMVHDSAAMAAAAAESSNSLNIFLLFIASISLLVAGVGVMNIMLVSVTERTREIGIRLALGASDTIILQQFLFEAIILCLSGGILGVALGIGGAHTLAPYMQWEVIITPMSVIVSFGITSAIGIFFGYYPALKASRLDPIVALAEH